MSAAGRNYDITVLTLIDEGGQRRVADQITFYAVGESVREFLAHSCRITLIKLIRFPEDVSPNAWNLKYRTVVLDAETKQQISDTRLITFPAMSRAHMLEFQRWAIAQLSDTVDVLEAERRGSPPTLRPRRVWTTLLRLIFTRQALPGAVR